MTKIYTIPAHNPILPTDQWRTPRVPSVSQTSADNFQAYHNGTYVSLGSTLNGHNPSTGEVNTTGNNISSVNSLHPTAYTLSSYSTLALALTPGAQVIDHNLPFVYTSPPSDRQVITSNEVIISHYSSLAGALGDISHTTEGGDAENGSVEGSVTVPRQQEWSVRNNRSV